jgi:hypothetical protein
MRTNDVYSEYDRLAARVACLEQDFGELDARLAQLEDPGGEDAFPPCCQGDAVGEGCDTNCPEWFVSPAPDIEAPALFGAPTKP